MERGTVVRAGEAAYTTGDWWLGSWKRGGPRKARASKSGGRVVRAWKSVAGELVVPGKAWAWKSNSTVEPGKAEVRGGRGADNNWRHDEGWRLSTRDWRQGDWRQEREEAGDSGQREEEQEETAAAQWQRSLIFSSQSKSCGARSGGSLLAGLNYALVDSLEFGGATHKSV